MKRTRARSTKAAREINSESRAFKGLRGEKSKTDTTVYHSKRRVKIMNFFPISGNYLEYRERVSTAYE